LSGSGPSGVPASVATLRTLDCVRERCRRLFELAKADKLEHFSLDLAKLPAVVNKVAELMARDYPDPDAVPYHSRWRHFESGGVDRAKSLASGWQCDPRERARRLVDLVTVSVLLDAGAGDRWRYTEPGTGLMFSRSEGLGVASIHMFAAGAFSSDAAAAPHRADATALASLPATEVAEAFQATLEGAGGDRSNLLVGCEGRAAVLKSLGAALQMHPEYFGNADGCFRPGNMVDFLFAKADPATKEVSIADVWEVVMYGYESMWPADRTALDGRGMGDVWPHSKLLPPPPALESGEGGNRSASGGDGMAGLVPFHKLSQWMTYSLMEPLEELGLVLTDKHLLTGLPEYRNGGLFVDLGVLAPRNPRVRTELQEPGAEVIVEWRALTVCLLDEVHARLREKLNLLADRFPLAKMLEAGTWKAGREVARAARPETGGPPIQIVSDGTVF
ncbi:unnamed protein product, partial [Phaeothamnion confervicola]